MRHNFRSLGDDLTNAVGNRSRQNFERLSQSVNVARRDLTRLRGIIPEAEFIRLDDAIRRSQRTMQRGFSNVGNRAFNRVAQQVREVVDGFRDLDQNSQIRIRVDHSALDRADALLERWRRDTSRQVTIRPDVDTNHMNQRIRRWAMGPLRGLGGLVGGILSDGLGQGLIGAFRSPLFGTAIVAAIVAALAFVGAALAGVLVLAIGGAFVGLGAMIAARSKEVTRNWEAEMKRLGPIFKDAAEPLVDVLHRATHILGDMGAEFAPKFKEALEKAAPHLDNFVDRTRDGLKKLGQGAWDSLQEAFRVFLDAFGPQWEDFLMELGKSLGALARTVTAHSEEMAMALRGVLGVINLLIDVVNFFANVWVMSVGIAQKGILGFFVVLQFIVEQIMGLFEMILAGATDAFSWVPGLGPQLEEAKAKFGTFRDSVNEKLQNMSDQARQWGVDMDNANKERVLRVDIASWQNQLARAKEELKSVPPEKKTELLGRINDLQNKISQANGALAAMQKDYYVRIHAYKVGDWAIGGGGPYAHGGVVGNHLGRAATGGARSNMTIVGEHGPELVNLPPGSHVRSNPDSRRMMGQQNGGGGATTLILKADGSRASNLILELLRDAIHDAGGDPVRVLGG
jgi:hypothetical protein